MAGSPRNAAFDTPTWVGAHRVLGHLGSGGMGEVYLARSPGGRLLAVKLVRPDLADDAEFRARFAREVITAQRVSGVFTAPVVDAELEAPVPWMATAYIAGPSLSEVVRHAGPLGEETTRRVGAGLGEALASIHQAALVHRDLKPGNVLLSAAGPHIIDFGVARATDATALTHTGQAIGTPEYMSPEQAEGHECTPASDVFSLGAVLVFACTGRGPFRAGTPASVLYRIAQQAPDLAGVPGRLAPLLAACLAKNPRDRPAAADLLPALRAGLTASSTTPALPMVVSEMIRQKEQEAHTLTRMAETTQPPPQPRPAPAATAKPRRSRRTVPVIAAACALVLVGTLAVVVLRTVPYGETSGADTPSSTPSAADGPIPKDPTAEPMGMPDFSEPQKVADTEFDVGPFAVSPDGSTLFGFQRTPDPENGAAPPGQELLAIDAQTGKPLFEQPLKDDQTYQLAVSPDGRTLAVGMPKSAKVTLLDASSGEQKQVIEFSKEPDPTAPGDPDIAMEFTSKGKGLITSTNWVGTAVWDPATGERIRSLAPFGGEAFDLSSDDSRFAIPSDEGGAVWTTGGEKAVDVAELSGLEKVAFQPGGRLLVGLGRDGLFFVDSQTGSVVEKFPNEIITPPDISMHPSGRYFVYGIYEVVDDTRIRVFDTAAQTEIGGIQEDAFSNAIDPDDAFINITFSADGNSMAATTFEGVPYIWEVG